MTCRTWHEAWRSHCSPDSAKELTTSERGVIGGMMRARSSLPCSLAQRHLLTVTVRAAVGFSRTVEWYAWLLQH